MKSASELLKSFEQHLQLMLEAPVWKTTLFEPMAYVLGLKAKRVRPVLAMLSYQAISGKNAQSSINLASALELFHNFTLIHDDILDEALMRRGMPTVHQKWNANTAILSGDGMFALSLELLVKDFPEEAARLVNEFSRMAVGVCEGQVEDMKIQGKLEVSLPVYLEMIRKKTAMLIGSCLCSGAIAAGADEVSCELFRKWGEAFGLGFQLRDDYLDLYGEGEKTGKKTGGDILQNKMTFLVLKAWEKSNQNQKEKIKQYLFSENDPVVKVAEIKKIFQELNIKQEAEDEMNKYFQLASDTGNALSRFKGCSEISDLFEQLKSREF